jgi:hypothetical protein
MARPFCTHGVTCRDSVIYSECIMVVSELVQAACLLSSIIGFDEGSVQGSGGALPEAQRIGLHSCREGSKYPISKGVNSQVSLE